MRKALLIVGLVAVSLLASAGSASAQWCHGYYGGWYGAYGYWPTYSYGYWPSYSTGYYAYYPTYYPTYYTYATPSYYYAAPVTASYVAPASTTVTRQSFYPSTDYASMNVRISDPDAQVWFDGALMTLRGRERSFYTPPLLLGSKHTYTVRARWTEDGRTMDQQRLIEVEPGRTVTIDFRSAP